MNISRRALQWVIAAWALCLALTIPLALSANGAVALVAYQQTTAEVLDGLMAGTDPALGPAEPSTSSAGWLTGTPFDVPAGALVVNTPGTDDTTLYRRIDPMRGGLDTVIVVYPQSLWPIISGNSGHWLPIFAPTYDQSVAVAVAHTLATMEGLQDASDKPYAVYTGYSQGADAVGDAAERAYAQGLLDPASTQVVLVSDPRSPWGIKQWARDNCLVGLVFSLVGATPDGARNPADTGDELPVTSVIVDGDPVANFQWVWYRPITSLIVDAAGFLAVHSLMGPQNYSNLDRIQDKETLYSRDGRTTYLVYHAEHPLTQLTEMIFGLVGIRLSDAKVAELDDFNNWYYPLQQPSPERAAPAAPVTTEPPAPTHTLDEASAVPVAATVAAPGQVDTASSTHRLSPEPAAAETTEPSAPSQTDDADSALPAASTVAAPGRVDKSSDEPAADTAEVTSSDETTQPPDDEDVAPESDLAEEDTSGQSASTSATTPSQSVPTGRFADAAENTEANSSGPDSAAA